MNYRTSIAQAMRDHISHNLDGSKPDVFFNNLYDNVSRRVLDFDLIKEFPYVAVHTGTETFEYLPSRQQWAFLSIPIFIYAKEIEDIQAELESLIADIKTLIDMGDNLKYTITKPDGTTLDLETQDITITAVSTDEGLLTPYGFAEINLTVRYMPLILSRGI